jgi:hypothetical protein
VRFLPRAAEWAALFFVIEDGDASPLWLKVKNPNAPAVKREAEEGLGLATFDKIIQNPD